MDVNAFKQHGSSHPAKNESADAPLHIFDLSQLLDVSTPTEAGPTGETYPFPWPPGQEPVDDPLVQGIGAAAKALDDARSNWLNPADASEAELKKRTLTNLYNTNPTWLQNLHATLDRAVWDAYGWPSDETPAEVEEDVILSRLLALNLERAE